MKISIAISTYDFHGKGYDFLDFSFQKISEQKYKNFNVIVSDNSENYDGIKEACKKWSNSFEINYYEHGGNKKSPAENSNNAILKSDGEIIKVLCGDDYLYDENSLDIIANNFTEETEWLFTSYYHTKNKEVFYRHYLPYMNPQIYIVNTLGTPSAFCFRNHFDDNILFDKNLDYCYDCDSYYRFYQHYGNPKIIDQIGIVNYIHEESVTSHTPVEKINKENAYILNKYFG